MMCLSDFVHNQVTSVYVGYAVTVLISLHLLVCIAMMTCTTIFGLKLTSLKKAAFSELDR